MQIQSQIHLDSFNWNRFSSTFIIEVKRGDSVFTSSAVALDSNMLLTAAHCVDCAEEVRLFIGDDYDNPIEIINASSWVIHPEYNPNKSFFENDLAIIYLNESLPRFTNVEAIDETIEVDALTTLERIGFGGRNGHNYRTWTNPLFESVTFNKKNMVLKDNLSVIGDSGGPIFKNDQGVLKLIGIHSTLEGDDKTYIVNLAPYKDWIENSHLGDMNLLRS